MRPKLKNLPKAKSAQGALVVKAQAQLQQAVVLHQQGRLQEASQIYEGLLQVDPKHFHALHLLGVIAYQTKNYEIAVDLIGKAISINSNNPAAYSNQGAALKELGQLQAAVASYDKAISLKSDYAEAHNNRGNALRELGQFRAALASCDKAISLKSNYADAHYNRGIVLTELGQFKAALASYDNAISFKPDLTEVHFNRGNALAALRQIDTALISYERAYSIQPELAYLLGTLIHARMQLCVWDKLQSRVNELIDKVQSNEKVVMASVLSLTDSREVHRKVAQIRTQDKHPAAAKAMWSGQRYAHKKIRLAYVSCDFKAHPATLNNIGMWERHDRARFEVIAISYGPVHQEGATVEGQLKTRLVKAFDRFLDVGDKSDEQIAGLMRELEVDIAVDISGTMQGSRQGILAHRPAPVQVNLYGYTSGAPYMDYIVADRVVVPPEHREGYTEKVVYMPDAWLANDATRQVSDRQFTRAELGLPEAGVVYCSFNNAYKINPQMFDVWMRILQRVPGSVLWLQGDGQEKIKENLRREASARGVDPARLVFAVKLESMAEHLARHRVADVFLDTLPFNAQTTAVDALWAGLPVLTCMGESIFARMAGSVLMALGMGELVSKDWQEYEEKAVRVGLEEGYAKSLKERLERNRVDAPLFDTQRLTHNMERAYEQMHHRVQQGLGPQAFEVQASYAA
jgi:predicted O-linked N-acetylglucosamine transferase (SPINDLY family)